MYLKPFAAEFFGTFALVFFGCGAQMTVELFDNPMDTLGVSLAFGLVVGAMVYTFGRVSGSHINPAVTLGLYLAGNIQRKSVVPYWIAQFLGSIAAMTALYLMLPSGSSMGATVPSVPIFTALVWEIVLTFFLMSVVMAVALDRKITWSAAGIVIGGMVTVCSQVGGGATGASMNPARSLGPALFAGDISSLWIYFVGPAIGAASAAIFFRWLALDKKNQDLGAFL